MSKTEEKKNWWIKGDYSPEDLGEIIKQIRVDYLEIDREACADQIGVKLNTFKSAENGKGVHIDNVLRKMIEKYDLKSSIIIKAK